MSMTYKYETIANYKGFWVQKEWPTGLLYVSRVLFGGCGHSRGFYSLYDAKTYIDTLGEK